MRKEDAPAAKHRDAVWPANISKEVAMLLEVRFHHGGFAMLSSVIAMAKLMWNEHSWL